MTIKIFRGIAAFLLFGLPFAFSLPASGHYNAESHKVWKGMGDSFRAIMNDDEYKGARFTVYVTSDATTTDKVGSATESVGTITGTGFTVRHKTGLLFLLTNKHLPDIMAKVEADYEKNAIASHAALFPPQQVNVRFTATYKAVDANGVAFLISLVKKSDSIDAASFRFQKEPDVLKESFVLQDEKEIEYSPVAIPGSPHGIENTLGHGYISRNELYKCGDDTGAEYISFAFHGNPGNSGSALFNLETDKVNGMVAAVFHLPSTMNNSMWCAVPASALIQFVDESAAYLNAAKVRR